MGHRQAYRSPRVSRAVPGAAVRQHQRVALAVSRSHVGRNSTLGRLGRREERNDASKFAIAWHERRANLREPGRLRPVVYRLRRHAAYRLSNG